MAKDRIKKINTVSDFDKVWGMPTRNPLINVLDEDMVTKPVAHCRKLFELYVIYIKDAACADSITYGRGTYDFDINTLVFVAPGQVLGHPEDGSTFEAKGWCLYFSPDLLKGTPLAKKIKDYTFFSYSTNEALHVSADERKEIVDCFRKIDSEIRQGGDSHSKPIIVSILELMLNYCARAYDRQFESRKRTNKDIIARFEQMVEDYYNKGRAQKGGRLSVNQCAQELNMSPNYFGDMVKKEMGVSPKEYINSRVLTIAKDLLWGKEQSVSEIGYYLGFQYPHYFTRFFKSLVGLSPTEYRNQH